MGAAVIRQAQLALGDLDAGFLPSSRTAAAARDSPGSTTPPMVNQYGDSGCAGSWPWSSSTRPLVLTGTTRADVRWMGAVVMPVILSAIDVRYADCEKLEEVRAERRLRPAKR